MTVLVDSDGDIEVTIHAPDTGGYSFGCLTGYIPLSVMEALLAARRGPASTV